MMRLKISAALAAGLILAGVALMVFIEESQATQPDLVRMPNSTQSLAMMLRGATRLKVVEIYWGTGASADGGTTFVLPWRSATVQFTTEFYCSTKTLGVAYTETTGIDTNYQRIKAGEAKDWPCQIDSIRVQAPIASTGLLRITAVRK